MIFICTDDSVQALCAESRYSPPSSFVISKL